MLTHMGDRSSLVQLEALALRLFKPDYADMKNSSGSIGEAKNWIEKLSIKADFRTI